MRAYINKNIAVSNMDQSGLYIQIIVAENFQEVRELLKAEILRYVKDSMRINKTNLDIYGFVKEHYGSYYNIISPIDPLRNDDDIVRIVLDAYYSRVVYESFDYLDGLEREKAVQDNLPSKTYDNEDLWEVIDLDKPKILKF